jgi:hypothetical protein
MGVQALVGTRKDPLVLGLACPLTDEQKVRIVVMVSGG